MKQQLYHLSKAISYILRHAPWEYELELDEEGWVSISNLLTAIKQHANGTNLTITTLEQLIDQSEKKRFELQGDKIRALYGHSTPIKLIKAPSTPPSILYHGTDPQLLDFIMAEGLKPMRRHYVHLSVDIETAKQVGSRKSNYPVVLIVDAKRANTDGIYFYYGNEKVWLADAIPSTYVSK